MRIDEPKLYLLPRLPGSGRHFRERGRSALGETGSFRIDQMALLAPNPGQLVALLDLQRFPNRRFGRLQRRRPANEQRQNKERNHTRLSKSHRFAAPLFAFLNGVSKANSAHTRC